MEWLKQAILNGRIRIEAFYAKLMLSLLIYQPWYEVLYANIIIFMFEWDEKVFSFFNFAFELIC